MKLPKRHDDAEGRREQALTPMIDLVFLLLTFFICASLGRVTEQTLATELAGTAVAADAARPAADPPPLGEVWVRLERAGGAGGTAGVTTATVDGRTYGDLGEVTAVLRGLADASAGAVPVILDVGGAVPAGDAVRVYDAARAAGFQTISFAADPPPAG